MYKKLFVFIIIFEALSVLSGYSQSEKVDNLSSAAKFQSVANRTYFAYKGGIGNIEPLKYEISFAPSFLLQLKVFPDIEFEFVPHIIVRSYERFSHPVRTPSYMPKGTLYYHIQKMPKQNHDMFAFLTYGHHSNGQDGLFYNSDSTINIIDGSFSSDYFWGGVIYSYPEKNVFNPVRQLKLSSIYYFIADDDVEKLYGKVRFFADIESSVNLSKERSNFFDNSRSKSKMIGSLHLGWIAHDLINANPIDVKRLILSYTLTYQPSFIPKMGLFTRFYYGQDYYNINFERTLTLFQFGLVLKDFNF